MKLLRILAVPVALISIGMGLWQLESVTAGLSLTRTLLGETPVTIFRPESGAPAPVVVIAHGFAGSQQLMQPFATTLARSGYLDERGPALGLLFFGLTLLGWPLAALLPRVSVPPTGAGLRWRKLLPVAIAPAILTPLILWKMPTHFLPILVGDYITIHFALYGLLTLAGLWLTTRGAAKESKAPGRPDYAVATWANAPSGREATRLAPPSGESHAAGSRDHFTSQNA